MCDIYMDRCHVCRKEIEMHLGDFMTSRWEILVFHKECFERVVMMLESDEDFPCIGWVMWKGDMGDVVIVSLTRNAWRNRYINHPNWGDVKLIKEVLSNAREDPKRLL